MRYEPTLALSQFIRFSIHFQIEKWLPLNRACFLLLNAYENADADTQKKLKSIVASKSSALKKQKHAASKLLVKNLNIK